MSSWMQYVAETEAEHKQEFKLTKVTPYLALMGELWGVCYEDLGEKRSHYNVTALYVRTMI